MAYASTKKPDNFVIASGKTHSVKEFVKLAFKYARIKNWQKYIKIDKKLLRPAEVDMLIGNSSRAKRILG